jgi:excinuclease UvrABC nuclease subunit
VLELDFELAFDPDRDNDFFSALPASPAVCLIEPKESSAQPLFIRTQDLRRRLQRLLGPPDPASKRLNLRDFTKSVRYRITASAFEQTLAYYQTAKQLFAARYKDMLRLRPPAVLKVNLRNAYPRCYPTRKISIDANGNPSGGIYYGPFPSRKAADLFAERVLDLFKVRRCQIKIRRDPTFPGCIYSEMKMCLAPCFAGCSKEEYDVEVQRLVAFLETGGNSLRDDLEAERNRASEGLDYEKAALLHKKLDKLDDALRGQPELPRRLQDLNAVILQRGVADQSICVYEVHSGKIAEPFELSFSAQAGDPRSAEQLLRQNLESADTVIPEQRNNLPVIPPAPSREGSAARNLSASASSAADLSEHLWLLARWFYSNPRQGEIFFRTNGWPYRRMMRACARLLAPREPQPDPNAPKSGQESEKTS